eukprot:g20564.t1
MTFHCGKWFYPNQGELDAHAPADVAIYIKFDKYHFTWFESLDEFWEWYFRAQEWCSCNEKAFPVYEMLRNGRDMCFIADLEVYCPPETHRTQLLKIEYIIKNLFRDAYGKYADADNLVITQNSRMSEHKPLGGEEKVPMYKISLHFLGGSEIFNEMHKFCGMKALAELVNTDLVSGIQELAEKHDILLPGGDVLDMGIYTKNRPMSLIGTGKELGGGAFERTEESKHVPIRGCIVTQEFTGDVSYFELPDGLKETAEQGIAKKKNKRNVPTKQLVHRPRTREASETEQLLHDYLQTEFGDTVVVTHQGLYGGQDSYAYKCMNPHAPRTAELDLREFHRSRSPPLEPRYLPPFTHVKSKVVSVSAPMRSGKTHQIENDIEDKKPKRALIITCRQGMAATFAGRFTGFTSYKDAINKDFQIIEGEEIHHIDHKEGGQELHVKFADEAAFVKMIQQDLRDGKRIGVCCGSAKELKTLEKVALDILGKEEVGIYYANSPKQAEIGDVSAQWPRDEPDHNRRTNITGVMTENQRELNRTIFKQGVGHEARFYPTLLTELGAWSQVERFLADEHWIQYLIQIFQAKGYTWSTTIDGVDDEEEKKELLKDFHSKGAAVKNDHLRLLDRVEVYEMDAEDCEKLVNKQRAGFATLHDVAKIEKYRVQRFYRDKINASDVEEFKKFRIAICTRAFFRAFPPIVRTRIDTTLQLMRESLDEFRPNYTIAKDIVETLNKMGFVNMGVAGERLDLKNMPDETKDKLNKTIESIRTVKLVRKSRADESLEEFKCYLKSIWGYNLKSHRVQRGAEKWRVYSLVDMVPEKFLCNEMYSDTWLQAHCRAVDKFVGSGHDEMALMKPLIPMMEMDLEPLKAASVATCPKRRRELAD